MSRARVAVLSAVSTKVSVTKVVAEFGISRRQLTRLIGAYRRGGLDALAPRSRRPRSNPKATPVEVRKRVIELRQRLTADGLDAGSETIRWHLEQEGLQVLSSSTIRRILHQAGLVTSQPRKRPLSSYIDFQADQRQRDVAVGLHANPAG